MSENKKVSIITPLFNGAQFVSETIASVLLQSYQNLELLIIDDGSTDSGPQIVEEYKKKDNRIKFIRNDHNLGPARTRNRGIEVATGRYIAFLDSDDIWLPNKLEVQLHFMEKNKTPFTFTHYEQLDEEGNFLKKMDYFPDKVDYRSTMMSNKIGCLTAMYDTVYFGKVYMADIRNRQDYTLWLQLLKKVKYAYCVPEILARYRIRKGSISSNKWKLIKYHWHIYRHIEQQPFFTSLYYITNYITLRLLRK
ncbi:glycosyltransferase family 2 protein [Parapedobacter koreensis]|uniref:Glycosyltransferase involved in cell wall bisynthesis n=1 Tax=Parapedobacter koreensis TaxID=332977 RepID=A0A1H7T8H1_9SPHI|nr:glycosyltransferase family 2 protein [Parapedobacter koreensis]SEL80566.1 Glycosyltransferase involved in cell wall bisynthesis [Parapedobacter koreensis]